MAVQPRNPARIMNRCTCWEVAAYRDGAEVQRLAFLARKTRSALLDVMRQNGPALLAMLPAEDDGREFTYAAGRWDLGHGVAVAFTGRTERECYWNENRA